MAVTEVKPDLKAFISLRYAHAGAAVPSRGRRWLCASGVVMGLLVGMTLDVAGFLLLLFPLILWLSVPKVLLIGNRYLLCGAEIVYFANLRAVVVSEPEGRLQLLGQGGRALVIERARFPTNARKQEKITRNKAAKFDKLVRKVVERVRKAVPNARIEGMQG